MVTVRLIKTAPSVEKCVHCVRLKNPPCFASCRTNLELRFKCTYCGIESSFPAQGYEKSCKVCGRYSNVEYMIAETIHARGSRLQYHVSAR